MKVQNVLLLICFSLYRCSSIKVEIQNGREITTRYNGKVTVTGIAHNGKSGACVETHNSVFYIHGMNSWNEDLLDTRVRVKGKSFTITLINTDAALEIQYVPQMDIIKNAKIENLER